MTATLLRIMESTEKSMQSPTVLNAAKVLYDVMSSDTFSDEQKVGAMFNYTAIVVSVAADKATIAALGQDVVESMFQEYEELNKMEASND